MHSVHNGRADTVGPTIQLGDFFPERRTVAINGETHLAWVTTNRRYPRPIQAALDRYRSRYMLAADPVLNPRPVADEDKQTVEERTYLAQERAAAIEAADEAYERFITDAVMALIPTLDSQTVDMINRESMESLLRDLGYFQAPEEIQASIDEQPQSGGTVDATPLTGGISTPDSAISTPGTPPSNS